MKQILPITCLILACSASQVEIQVSEQSVTTLAQARSEYLAGLKALKEGEYLAAIESLQRVARAPSYTGYAALARLRLADAFYLQEKYEEAAEAYRSFIETNYGDSNLHYAAFMLAQSRVKAMPAEFILIPPADRRDQRRVRAILNTLMDFIERFPDSPYIEEALALQEKMIKTVVSFEMEVARFYMTRDKPLGAVMRLKRLLSEVPRAGANEATRFALIEALASAGDKDSLQKECNGYMERFPGGKNRDRVASYCANLSK